MVKVLRIDLHGSILLIMAFLYRKMATAPVPLHQESYSRQITRYSGWGDVSRAYETWGVPSSS